jgi:hypothetical protein
VYTYRCPRRPACRQDLATLVQDLLRTGPREPRLRTLGDTARRVHPGFLGLLNRYVYAARARLFRAATFQTHEKERSKRSDIQAGHLAVTLHAATTRGSRDSIDSSSLVLPRCVFQIRGILGSSGSVLRPTSVPFPCKFGSRGSRGWPITNLRR